MARPLKPALQWHVDHWRFRCRVKDGGRPYVELPVGLTKAEAEGAALKLAQAAAAGELAEPNTPTTRRKAAPSETVAQWCTRWCEEREERGLTSVRGDRGRLATYVLPIIGPRPIATVTQEQIEAVVIDLDKRVRAKTMSWKTASNVWGNVSKLFDDASHAKDRTLRVRSDNPAKGIRGPDRGTKKVKAFLYPSEARALLACEAVPLDFRKAAALAIYLGLRAGELRSLRWDDIDIEHGTVHVHQSYDRDKHAAKATKTKSARRFTFEPTVRPLLAAMHAEAEGKGLVLDMRRFFKSADDLRTHLRTAGVTRADLFVTDETRKNLTFHDLRATTLTWMAVRGDDPLKIKARAGHSDLATTEGYIRTAGEIDGAIGTVFAPLPNGLTGGFGQASVSASGSVRRETGSKMGRPQEESDLYVDSDDPVIPTDSGGATAREGGVGAPLAAVSIPVVSALDAVEAALAEAVVKATLAGQWGVVKALVGELEARRSARVAAGGLALVDLTAERRRRDAC